MDLVVYCLIVFGVAVVVCGIIWFAPIVSPPLKQWLMWGVGAIAAIVILLRVMGATPALSQVMPTFPYYEPSELCIERLGELEVYPPACYLRYIGYPCEEEQNPPEGWLRPGGYCDRLLSGASISYDFDGPAAVRYQPK